VKYNDTVRATQHGSYMARVNWRGSPPRSAAARTGRGHFETPTVSERAVRYLPAGRRSDSRNEIRPP